MNSKEILTSIKELVGLSKEKVANEVEATEEVILSTEVVAEEVIEEKVEEVELSTEETKEEVIEEAVELAQLGKGSLVSSIVTNSDAIAKEYVVNAASHHGRILVLNRENAKQSTGHGSPMPLMKHGGPGRAGGGEEMGGKRGVLH